MLALSQPGDLRFTDKCLVLLKAPGGRWRRGYPEFLQDEGGRGERLGAGAKAGMSVTSSPNHESYYHCDLGDLEEDVHEF